MSQRRITNLWLDTMQGRYIHAIKSLSLFWQGVSKAACTTIITVSVANAVSMDLLPPCTP